MEWLYTGVVAWLISPILLLCMLVRARNKKKKQQMLLRYLLDQGRIAPEELQQADLLDDVLKQPLPNAVAVPSLVQATTAAQQIPASADAPLSPPQIASSETTDIVPEHVIVKAADTLVPSSVPEQTVAEPVISDAAHIEDTPDITEPAAALTTQQITVAETESDNVAIVAPTEAVPQPKQSVRTDAVLPKDYLQKRTAGAAAQTSNPISAITLMLSVGVLLVIVAGLIFVRTTWGKLTDGGRLATLAAGSVLFFGTSALARRVWKLTRTSMAFFTLGSAFLPISIWAAGYLNLLGEKLSGAGNPWLIALACGSFTIISLIASQVYRQKGWGVSFLSGLTVTYISLAVALTVYRDTSVTPLLTAVTLYALILAFTARLLASRIPAQIGSVLEPFTMVLGILFAAVTWCCGFGVMFDTEATRWSYAIPIFIAAFIFFSPIFTERMKAMTALPISLLTATALINLLMPLYKTVFTIRTESNILHATNGYVALILMLCAAIWLVLLLTNSLPDETCTGFRFAAIIQTALSIPIHALHFFYYPPTITTILACATVVLAGIWIFTSREKASLPLHILIGAQIWSFCSILAEAIGWQAEEASLFVNSQYLMQAGCFLLGFAALILWKKHRTGWSDILLTVSAAIPLLTSVERNVSDGSAPMQYIALGLLLLIVLLDWKLALAHDTQNPGQYIFAVLSPLLLFATTVSAANGLLEQTSDSIDVILTIVWSVLSYLLGAAVYLTTKRRFHNVRRLLFGLTMVPPIVLTLFYQDNPFRGYNVTASDYFDAAAGVVLICISIIAAFGLWRLFSNHGFRPLANVSFGIALILAVKMTAQIISIYYQKNGLTSDFTLQMISTVGVILFSLLAIAISRRMLFFVGSKAITAVMQFAAPITAFILSCLIVDCEYEDWNGFYFVYVFGLSILAWFTTKKSQIILPAICALSFILTVDTLRENTFSVSIGGIFQLLLLFVIMTALFPYLGIVSREADEKPKLRRRSWVLTAMGGIAPLWLSTVISDGGTAAGRYTPVQREWLHFFVPILIAGYLLHFRFVLKKEKHRRFMTILSAAFGVFAFWMQPLVDVTDTWFEGKLHILPLILFGIVLRQLYGEKTGGNFLFGVGVYTMFRLAGIAFETEAGADILTLLITAMIMFIASFYIKQRKWFLLGGLSLMLTAMYMHMRITEGRQWWVYLLLAGLILIVVAGSNEMLKQRGESLKSKTGRLWEDWTW